ncbi:hypothetical protein BURK1_02888 [Burkholderiales bacterium]|nr:hypothetical protein BURK1_02888 [Burkholderiales bacterium]
MSVERQASALLALVEEDRARKCDAIDGAARARAGAIVREAHAAARARMRTAFAEERSRMDARVAAARANLDTRRRAAANAFAGALIAAGVERLPAALDGRWADAPARRAWVDDAIRQARALLPRGAWRIAHAPGWPQDERDALAADLSRTHGTSVAFAEEPALGAGLAIASGGNVVDGTRAGLTSDRDEIGALLLATMEGQP